LAETLFGVVILFSSNKGMAMHPRTGFEPQAQETAAALAQRRERVLVVEDSKAISSLLCASIELLPGLAVTCAANFAEAQQLLATGPEQYFLAVLDLNLPDAPNGEIVDLVQGHGIPVIVLSAAFDEDRRRTLFEKNIVDYVDKQQLSGVEYVIKLIERIYASRKLRVLVVDDSASFRSYAEILLQNHGYRTCTAANGTDALSVLQAASDIRLVVTDYHMPVMDGLEMVRQIRLTKSREQLAIIGISDNRNPEVSIRFLKAGASDFLAKPFQLEEFYCRVDQNLDMLRLLQEARDAADRDFLTKVYNRRYFFKHAELHYQRAVEGDYAIAVAMIDVDHFKAINDTYGHQFGDRALQALAALLTEVAAGNGMVARFGGEEFVYLRLLDANTLADQLMEELRHVVSQLEQRHNTTTVSMTVSVGVTENIDGDFDQMLARADQAVYLAKEAGRNCVMVV